MCAVHPWHICGRPGMQPSLHRCSLLLVAQESKKEEGAEEGWEGVKTEELSPLLTPKTLRPRPGLMTGNRAGCVFSSLINRIAALAINKVVAMSRSTPSRLFVPFCYYKMCLIIVIHKTHHNEYGFLGAVAVRDFLDYLRGGYSRIPPIVL